MAGKSNLSATLFAQKKLFGKANTSVVKSDAQETIGSNIQVAAQTIFAEDIPDNPSQTLYLLQNTGGSTPNTVEWVQFDLEAISGTTYDANTYDDDSKIGNPQDAGPHAYKLKLSGSYQTLSSNPKKGQGVFDNSKTLFETLGSLQIVPPNFSGQAPNPYILKLYKGDPSNIANEIPLLDEIDWSIDYYNGILFLQDYDAAKIPLFARGFVYVGEMLSGSLGSSGGGSGDITAVTAGSGLTGGATTGAATVNVGAGTGIIVNANDVAVDNSIVATLTGSVFSGHVGVTGSIHSTSEISGSLVKANKLTGSLTHLEDGSSYLIAGNNVTITTGSSGAVTIAASSGDISGASFVSFASDASLTNERVLTAGTGITIDTSSPGTITINSDGLVARNKTYFDITSSYTSGETFHTVGVNFANSGYDFNKIDVFLNGQLLRSGSSHDYLLNGTGSFVYYSTLEPDDSIAIITF